MSYRVPDERVMEAIFAADSVLTAMVTKNARPPEKVKPGANPDFTFADVFRWAQESGGEVLRAEKGGGEAFERTVERLRTRYSLHYRGPELADGAGTFRRIQVKLSDAGKRAHGNVQIRARSGYFLLAAPQ
jgi:hypothetical protein